MMKKIYAQPLQSNALEGMGKGIFLDGVTPDVRSDIQEYFGKLAIFPAAGDLQFGICIAKDRPLILDEMEQHVETAEILIALKGGFAVAFAPDGAAPDIQKASAVRVEQGQGVLLNKGVWHWTPYAIASPCEILVVFKENTPKNDFTSVKLDEPIEISVTQK